MLSIVPRHFISHICFSASFFYDTAHEYTHAPSSCRRMRGSLTGRERALQRRPNINFYSGRFVSQKRFCGEVCVGTFPLMLSLVCSFCLFGLFACRLLSRWSAGGMHGRGGKTPLLAPFRRVVGSVVSFQEISLSEMCVCVCTF